MDECAGARRVSGLVAALEVSLARKSRCPRNLATGCSDLKLNLATARFRGNEVPLVQNPLRCYLWHRMSVCYER